MKDIQAEKEDIDYKNIEKTISDKLFQENLYDPQLDYRDEDWVKQNICFLIKLVPNKDNIVLSCPQCFT